MSDSKNKVNFITVEEFENITADFHNFFLCFKGQNNDTKNERILNSINRLSNSFPRFKFYCIDWNTFKSKKLNNGRGLIYSILIYINGKETKCITYTSKNELYSIIVNSQTQFPILSNDSQQPQKSEKSLKAESNNEVASDAALCSREELSGKRTKKRKHTEVTHTSEYIVPNISSPSTSLSLNKNLNFPRYPWTSSKNPNISLVICEPGEKTPYQPTVSPPHPQSSAQYYGTISSNYMGRSTPILQISPTHHPQSLESERVLQISPVDSLDLLLYGSNPRRSASNTSDSTSGENRFVFPSSPTSSVGSTISSKSPPKQATSPSRYQNQQLCTEPSLLSTSHQPSGRYINTQLHDHTYTSFFQGPMSGTSSHHVSHQRQNQPRRPYMSQRNTRRRVLPHQRRRTTSISTLSSNRLPTQNINPNRGNNSLL